MVKRSALRQLCTVVSRDKALRKADFLCSPDCEDFYRIRLQPGRIKLVIVKRHALVEQVASASYADKASMLVRRGVLANIAQQTPLEFTLVNMDRWNSCGFRSPAADLSHGSSSASGCHLQTACNMPFHIHRQVNPLRFFS